MFLFPSARNQTSAGVAPQGSGANASQDLDTPGATGGGGDPQAEEREGEGTEETEETGDVGKVCLAFCQVYPSFMWVCMRVLPSFARVSMLSVGIYDLCACVHGLRAYIHMIYVRVFGEGDRGHARHWG